jgi:hypothetical protein
MFQLSRRGSYCSFLSLSIVDPRRVAFVFCPTPGRRRDLISSSPARLSVRRSLGADTTAIKRGFNDQGGRVHHQPLKAHQFGEAWMGLLPADELDLARSQILSRDITFMSSAFQPRPRSSSACALCRVPMTRHVGGHNNNGNPRAAQYIE